MTTHLFHIQLDVKDDFTEWPESAQEVYMNAVAGKGDCEPTDFASSMFVYVMKSALWAYFTHIRPDLTHVYEKVLIVEDGVTFEEVEADMAAQREEDGDDGS